MIVTIGFGKKVLESGHPSVIVTFNGHEPNIRELVDGFDWIPSHEEVLEIIQTIFRKEDLCYPKVMGFKGRGMFMDEIKKIYEKV